MTKILYIVGSGSKNSDWELRWSLRSLDKFALDEVEPVIVGNVPDWFNGDAVVCGDKFDRKEKNINRKIMKAIEKRLVTGEFQISADDHFWIEPTEFAKLPIVHREGLLPCLVHDNANNYEKALVGTFDALLRFKYPRFNTACHFNAWANAKHIADVEEVIRLANSKRGLAGFYGVVAWAVWPNVMLAHAEKDHNMKRGMIQIKDLKYRGEDDFAAFIDGAGMFSINDKAFGSQEFIDYMQTNFGGKSRWEK